MYLKIIFAGHITCCLTTVLAFIKTLHILKFVFSVLIMMNAFFDKAVFCASLVVKSLRALLLLLTSTCCLTIGMTLYSERQLAQKS